MLLGSCSKIFRQNSLQRLHMKQPGASGSDAEHLLVDANEFVPGRANDFAPALMLNADYPTDSDAEHIDANEFVPGRANDFAPALMLNADYQPLSLVPISTVGWQQSIKAVVSGRVRVVQNYENITIRAVNSEYKLPSVIALHKYMPQASHTSPVFTRRNVFLRDAYECQYCGNRYPVTSLSLDHVIPRSRGGELSWTNTVTCCRRCNEKKGSRTPSQLRDINMSLKSKPRKPTSYDLYRSSAEGLDQKFPEEWMPFIPSSE